MRVVMGAFLVQIFPAKHSHHHPPHRHMSPIDTHHEDPFLRLPDELLDFIFIHLDLHSLLNVQRVNRRFHDYLTDPAMDIIWKYIALGPLYRRGVNSPPLAGASTWGDFVRRRAAMDRRLMSTDDAMDATIVDHRIEYAYHPDGSGDVFLMEYHSDDSVHINRKSLINGHSKLTRVKLYPRQDHYPVRWAISHDGTSLFAISIHYVGDEGEIASITLSEFSLSTGKIVRETFLDSDPHVLGGRQGPNQLVYVWRAATESFHHGVRLG
jgi:hypothetical protein